MMIVIVVAAMIISLKTRRGHDSGNQMITMHKLKVIEYSGSDDDLNRNHHSINEAHGNHESTCVVILLLMATKEPLSWVESRTCSSSACSLRGRRTPFP